ncbi:HpcH/HpaI aldolase/citrate lyase family protein [Burkholderia stagnalis]|uniref:Aldolase n=1 Tax=Burkholderia stagnalis TaxID=1503054 RepID=A0A119H2Q2_9BURK|nr:CoA ester lyase [Burkholderia stagnalis]AOK54689.1 aldolase [Burkholderia stagnalis]KVN78596.1 aldolase [Burkholderia stagnalis]KVZ16302.1 aldolase [Burkholderia stagnalis]KWA43713.1 aldolase [Burkholderia stagnalis]KWA63839.1 aldolase [Burkholderia stagnalis]
MTAVSPRSWLFVPGNRAERFDKARASGADAVILDLEDAVPLAEKPAARAAVVAHLDAARPAWVRVNATDTAWFADDVAAIAAHPGAAGVMLPKCETRAQVDAVLAHAHAQLALLPLIETARGIAGLGEVCAAPRVARVAFGTLDFQVDLGIDGDGDELNAFRSQIVLASRLAGIEPPVDGVSTVIDDAAAIERQARAARKFGFGGKLCIHPKQLDAVHRAYAWSDAERAWAARVLDAVEASGGAAVAVDGKMVDAPVILKARRIMRG